MTAASTVSLPPAPGEPANLPRPRVLVVDDDAAIRHFCCYALETQGFDCHQAADGADALERLRDHEADVVLLDIDMPQVSGDQVLRYLRTHPPAPNLKIIMFSGRVSTDELAESLLQGADSYLPKPFSLVQLVQQVKAAVRLKASQDSADQSRRRLQMLNELLAKDMSSREAELASARNMLWRALAKVVELRDTETGGHVQRVQRYNRCLAEEAARHPHFAGLIDASFLDMLDESSPLHDIGKIGLPDHILFSTGELTPQERQLMQSHTELGAQTLQAVATLHGGSLPFLPMAIAIARHHHERFDGAGYPDQLAGDAIPLPARLMAIADVYDALRNQRRYKAPFAHDASVKIMLEHSPGHFDPCLLEVFAKCADSFAAIFNELTD